ncbi:MAG: flagellar filament capping protein FliD [Anaerolineae bacterium]
MAVADFTRIASNIGALNALHSLRNVNRRLGVHQQRLATGQNITIDTTDSLNDIKGKINLVDYEGAGVEAVVATVVDNKLVLTSANTGTNAAISYTDGTGGGDGLGFSQAQAAEDASLAVNGVSVTRQGNTGLNDVISGLTLNLKKEATTQLTVAKEAL